MKKKIIILSIAFFLGSIILGASAHASGSGVNIPTDTGLPGGTIKDILSNLLMWLLGIFGMLALISFIISGVQYLMAAGDDKGMETAKRNMMYSTVGIVIALSGYIIVKAIDTALRSTNSVF
jgi:hypothetical protein